MAAPFDVLPWEDFSAGIYRGREAPPGSVYDALNALVDDEGQLFKRGVTTYQSGANAGATLEGLIDAYLVGGRRTVFWSQTAEDVYVLDADDSTVVTVSAADKVWRRYARGAVVQGYLFVPGVEFTGGATTRPFAYAGSRKTSDPALATIATTNGSKTVTGSGTSWLTTADAGMFVQGVGGTIAGQYGVVKSITNNTTLELRDPWTGATTGGASASLLRFHGPGLADPDSTDLTYVASVAGRLVVVQGSRVFYSPGDDPFGGSAVTDYHDIPDSSLGIGADALGNDAIAFTTAGVWAVRNMFLDAIDDFGNIQRPVEKISGDVILWGDPGIAAWESVLVVPAVDDVYLLGGDGQSQQISAAIRPLYRGYVKAGYQPGLAAVHRGHYFLPVMNGTTLVDVLVCRLDRPAGESGIRPWTRWSGHAAGAAYAQRIGSATRSPELFGISGERVTDLSGCMDVTAAATTDADLTTATFRVDSSDFDLGPGVRASTATIFRQVYETTGGTPVVTVSSAVGAEGASFSAATLKVGGGSSDGTTYSSWRIDKRAERIRVRVESVSGVTKLLLRKGALSVRGNGRG